MKTFLKWFFGLIFGIILIGNIMQDSHKKEKEEQFKNDFNAEKSTLIQDSKTLYNQGKYEESITLLNKYNNIKDSEKDSIINDAQSKINERELQEKAKRIAKGKEILLKMHKEHDDIKDITWYFDKSSPRTRNANAFYLYFAKDNLRLNIQYASDNWLFIKKVTIKTDNDLYSFDALFQRDNGSGGIWEWADLFVEKKYIKMMEDIATSKQVKVRYEGSQYTKDITLTDKQKKAIGDVLAAYEAL